MTIINLDEINSLANECHGRSAFAGWWSDPITGESLIPDPQMTIASDVEVRYFPYVVATKIALIHSEISEALEGFRTDAMDDKLPQRKAIEVELADAIIRIGDLAGALRLDLAGAIKEKFDFNATRPDHKPSTRAARNGKKF